MIPFYYIKENNKSKAVPGICENLVGEKLSAFELLQSASCAIVYKGRENTSLIKC